MWSAFVALVGYFPNLRNLKIFATSFRADGWPIPRVSSVWRGRLFIDLISRSDFNVPVDWFSELKLEYEEIEIYGSYERHLVAAVEKSLKCLKIDHCDCTPF